MIATTLFPLLAVTSSVFAKISFFIFLVAAIGLFVWQLRAISATVNLGRPDDRSDRKPLRLKQMLLVAFGQQKMFKRWIPAVLHLILYVSFIVINIEVLEIIIDGLTGSHRVLGLLGPVYDGLMFVNEWLAVLVIVSVVILLIRRQVLKLPRFQGREMTHSKGMVRRRNYSHLDAAVILWTEIVLMLFLLLFNSADMALANLTGDDLAGVFPFSGWIVETGLFQGLSAGTLETLVAVGWWGHIVGIFLFLNYLPISKHFHILAAFPNTYFSNVGIKPKGEFGNLNQVTEEMKAILDPSYEPAEDPNAPQRFGAKDVPDLSWKSLLDSYTCTECGRCTAVCPANITGKKLSPRKIIMDTRDRLEEIRKFDLTKDEEGVIVANGSKVPGAEEAAAHTLLGDFYITEEELNACTTCNACVEACPVQIDHLAIILPLRQYLVMEESNMPEEWGIMSNNIENAGNPWAMPSASRFDWAQD